MDLFITINGDRAVQEKFLSMGSRAANARPAMQQVALFILETMDRIFASQGAHAGEAWEPISAEWADRKARLGLDPRILHATLALRDSMSNIEDPNQFLRVTNRSVTLTSLLPYAEAQNRARRFAVITQEDRFVIRKIIEEYLMGAWR
jgi:phage gpG-like protein